MSGVAVVVDSASDLSSDQAAAARIAIVPLAVTFGDKEYQAGDPRLITTDQERCIGCGTCVEVCPANLANGGQTLRVMEAPARDWFVALEELEQAERT